MENTLMVKPSFATTSIGVATVIFSFGGTIAAGRLLDRLGQAYGGKSCAMACALCSVCSFLTIPIGFCLAYVTNAYFFIAYYSLFIFIMLMAAGTFPLAILWTVPREQRVTASAVVSFIVNIFGTVPAPVVVGYLNQGFTSEADKEAGISVMPSTVLYIVICWMVFPTVLGALCGIGAKLRGVGSNVDKHG
jgi:MFS family permease